MPPSPAARSQTLRLFQAYMRVTGTPTLAFPTAGDRRLHGKSLGIVNGSAWTTLWSNYFGRLILPEVKLVNVGNEAVQLSFMRAHHDGEPCPPPSNIQAFCDYAEDLVRLASVDAILLTCSTMNRSHPAVARRVRRHGVPVVSIDQPMMEAAVRIGGRVLVVATHGPTVESTGSLLRETAAAQGRAIEIAGATVEAAFAHLGAGEIERHNRVIAAAIRRELRRQPLDVVVLAQLSMSVFKIEHPQPEKTFGVPVLTSGEEGFKRMREILLASGRPRAARAAAPH